MQLKYLVKQWRRTWGTWQINEFCQKIVNILQIYLLLIFDELFDSVNGSYANKKKFAKPLLQSVKPNSAHHKKWMEFKKNLKSMKFYKGKSSENVPTLNSWVWTLEGIQILVKKLERENNITSVWMRHLNQDPLENFFGAIRSHGCRNVNPTPDTFQSGGLLSKSVNDNTGPSESM